MRRQWIVDALGDAALFDRLAKTMKGTELWSVLMEVMRERARVRRATDVLAQYRRDAFVRPAPIDQRTLVEVDVEALAAAAAFEAIELSPVAPLGASSSMGVTDQHRVLSALRGTEVVSDPTNVLALECAERLSRTPRAVIKLATSQRVVRAQQIPKVPGFTQHFRIFVLATAGREKKDHAFVVDAMVEHVHTMLAALDRLEAHGYDFGRRRVDILATREREAIGNRIANALGDIAVKEKPLEHPYYSGGLRFMLWVTDPAGSEVPLVDGGAFDWLVRLTSNRRYVFVASGMGAQLIPLRFRVGD
ncbi:MAG TPA: hypothetical protein VFB62_08750 [Polyangiaceae bacterium]|nr:hypothetical protein [Polyangiaceae bacterium]